MNQVISTARQAMGWASARRDARARRAPRLQGTAAAKPASVYYLCPDVDVPTGGIRTIYRHVDALNSLGIRAAVVHGRSGFSCSWFEHDTNVTDARSARLGQADVLVLPEFYSSAIAELPDEPHLVMFNQNTYQTFAGRRPITERAPRWDTERITAVMVVSRDNEDYMRYAFPRLRVERVRNVVDSQVFHPGPAPHGRRIAVMPRRRAADCRQVLDLLSVRGCLGTWDVVSIDGRSERVTADLLRSSSVFLSFSELEGFGMPPAEAMACGCYVVGFTGLAGREYFDPAICTPVEEGNVLAFAKAVEQTLAAFDADGRGMRERALAGSATIRTEYSADAQRGDLRAFFGSLTNDFRDMVRALSAAGGEEGSAEGRHQLLLIAMRPSRRRAECLGLPSMWMPANRAA